MVEIANNQGADLLTKPFEISVNKKPVSLTEPIVTGLEIKPSCHRSRCEHRPNLSADSS